MSRRWMATTLLTAMLIGALALAVRAAGDPPPTPPSRTATTRPAGGGR